MNKSKILGLPNLVWVLMLFAGIVMPLNVLAATSDAGIGIDLTGTWLGMLALAIFFAAYVLIISEEAIRLRKSKPIQT